MTREHATTPSLANILGTITSNEPWRDQAACRTAVRNGADPDDWFPERGATLAIARAKAVCSTCPAKHACLEDHLWEEHGIWGGETEVRRKDIRNGRRGVA